MSLPSTDRADHARGRRYDVLGRLALGVAHDFNNILTTVLGLSSFLRHRTAPGQELATELAEIERACERGASLTAQLLALQPGSGAEPRGSFHPQDTLVRLQPLLHRVLGERVRLEMRFDPDLEFVAFDAEELADLLLHAAAMGRTLLPAGGALRVEIAPAAAAAAEAPVRIGVRVALVADGSGRPPEECLRLDLRLPVAARSLELVLGDPASPVPPPDPAEPPSSSLARRTVLLVEDDDGLRRLCMRVLEDRGFWVTTAFDAFDALEACEQRGSAFDLLVSDCALPGMSGGDLWAALAGRYPMPAVFMTGYRAAAVAPAGAPDRPSIVVAKPFGPDALVAAIRQVLAPAADPPSRNRVPARDERDPGWRLAAGASR